MCVCVCWQGRRGRRGERGPPGEIGDVGLPGYPGAKGEPGSQGLAVRPTTHRHTAMQPVNASGLMLSFMHKKKNLVMFFVPYLLFQPYPEN